jgi:hypothetical protein
MNRSKRFSPAAPGYGPLLAVEIHTGTANVQLPDDLYQELAERLSNFGAPDAAEQLRTQQAIRNENKPVVREVIGRWQRSGTPEASDAQLEDLANRLGGDVRRALERESSV